MGLFVGGGRVSGGGGRRYGVFHGYGLVLCSIPRKEENFCIQFFATLGKLFKGTNRLNTILHIK